MEEKNLRPWGYYQILSDAADHKVKRILVVPGGTLSLQRHTKRAEHWYAVSGSGDATIDGEVCLLSAGSAVDTINAAAAVTARSMRCDIECPPEKTKWRLKADHPASLNDNGCAMTCLAACSSISKRCCGRAPVVGARPLNSNLSMSVCCLQTLTQFM